MKLADVRVLRCEIEEYRQLLALLPGHCRPGGCTILSAGWKAEALERRLQRLTAQLAEELWEVTKLIAEIQEPELRLIFERRYFQGESWEQVASGLPTRLSPDGARMKHDRYLKKHRPGEEDRSGAVKVRKKSTLQKK